jgi:hypothetical protein
MVDQLTIQTISVLVAAASVVAFVTNSILTSRREEKRSQQSLESRQAQLFMGIYQQIMSPAFSEAEYTLSQVKLNDMKDWEEMMRDREQFKAFNIYGFVFNGIGVLVKENLIDLHLPMMFYGGGVVFFWRKFGPYVREARVRWSAPSLLVQLEELYDLVVRYAGEHPEFGVSEDLSFGMDASAK